MQMTFISALLSLGFFILIFKAMAKDISSTQSKSTDEQPDLDFVTISTQLDYINELKDNIQNIENMITEIEICEPAERATSILNYSPSAIAV